MTTPSPSPTPRSCGPCTACCTALAITPLQKPAGSPCSHLTPNSGCSIYADRPNHPQFAHCISFSCLWLDGHFAPEDRPDLLGGLFMLKPDNDYPSQNRVYLVEIAPGSASTPRAKALLKSFLDRGLTVAVTNPQFVIALRPGGHSWKFTIDPTDPLHSNVDPNSPPIQLTAFGLPITRNNPNP